MTHWKIIVVAVFLALVAACDTGPLVRPTPTPNTNQVYETAQTRINQLQATADAQGK